MTKRVLHLPFNCNEIKEWTIYALSSSEAGFDSNRMWIARTRKSYPSWTFSGWYEDKIQRSRSYRFFLKGRFFVAAAAGASSSSLASRVNLIRSAYAWHRDRSQRVNLLIWSSSHCWFCNSYQDFAEVFGCTSMHQRILRADNLASRGMQPNPLCPLCNSIPEDAREVLRLLWSWFHLQGWPSACSLQQGPVDWLYSNAARANVGNLRRATGVLLYCWWKEKE
jgi:hypothetical protein